MKILVINTGSSSIKYELFDMTLKETLVKGLVERIGEEDAVITCVIPSNEEVAKNSRTLKIATHHDGLELVVEDINNSGVIESSADIDAIGHRVVHGGEFYSKPAIIDDQLKKTVEELIPLAPLHNPSNLMGIEVAEHFFPDAVQVAVFDTAFHQTMPPASYRFPIPNRFYDDHKVRAYGFHGTSHAYVSNRYYELVERPKEDLSIVTIHLGNGCSMAAIRNGKCIDTTMGLSPLAGLMMGTRSGDIDPSIPFFMVSQLNMSIEEVDKVLNKESGLLGIAGSNDMRDVLKKRSAGDENAILAIDMYVLQIKKYIGAYAAEMGSLDAVIFTAGIGENSDEIRSLVCDNMNALGIELDYAKNADRSSGDQLISTAKSAVQVWNIATNEELQIALGTQRMLEKK